MLSDGLCKLILGEAFNYFWKNIYKFYKFFGSIT